MGLIGRHGVEGIKVTAGGGISKPYPANVEKLREHYVGRVATGSDRAVRPPLEKTMSA